MNSAANRHSYVTFTGQSYYEKYKKVVSDTRCHNYSNKNNNSIVNNRTNAYLNALSGYNNQKLFN